MILCHVVPNMGHLERFGGEKVRQEEGAAGETKSDRPEGLSGTNI